MSENGKKEILLSEDELLSAVTQYLARRNIHYGRHNLTFEWILTPEEGYQVPPMKETSMRIRSS